MLSNIFEKAQADIVDALYASAEENCATTNSLLVPVRPGTYSYQSLAVIPSHYISKGHPRSPEQVLAVAGLLNPLLTNLPEQFTEIDSSTHVISNQVEVLRTGQSIGTGTDHLTLVDIAYLGALHSLTLKRGGAEHRSLLIASKAADYMAVDTSFFDLPKDIVEKFAESLQLGMRKDGTIPLRNFVGIAYDEMHLTIPNTKSFESLRGVQGEAVLAHNALAKNKLGSSMKNKTNRLPASLYVAVHGSKNKELDREKYAEGLAIASYYNTYPEEFDTSKDIEVVGRFSRSMLDFLGNALTYAATLRLSEDSVKVAINPDPIALIKESDLERFGCKLIDTVNGLGGTQTVHDRTGNLPIKPR